MKIVSALLLLSAFAHAESYDLKNLKGVSVSFFNSSPGQKTYLRFQNEQGTHTIAYDESATSTPLKEIQSLAQVMLLGTCELELDCSVKAVCTGDCHSMYYEITNAPADPQFAARNKCKIKSFTCAGK